MASAVPLNRVYLGVHILESIIHIHAVAVPACSYMLVATLIVVYLSISPSAGFCGRFLPCLIVVGDVALIESPNLWLNSDELIYRRCTEFVLASAVG
jgi:hypothetical protein